MSLWAVAMETRLSFDTLVGGAISNDWAGPMLLAATALSAACSSTGTASP